MTKIREFTKHIVIHGDVIVKAKSKKEAQEIYEQETLLLDRKDIRFAGELIDEETTNWIILKK